MPSACRERVMRSRYATGLNSDVKNHIFRMYLLQLINQRFSSENEKRCFGLLVDSDGAAMTQAARTLLCIEDDREVAKLIVEEMTDRGFKILIAHDGHEGLVAILKGIPDLVLCDIGLPHLSGIELLERLNELSPQRMPFILLTALCDRKNKLRAKRLGIDNCVTKPIDFDALETIICARLADIALRDNWLRLANLSDRQANLLTWAARGKSSTQIAEMLGLVEKTVQFDLDRARFKLAA
jgi:DNA-binding response OmpR family regulator